MSEPLYMDLGEPENKEDMMYWLEGDYIPPNVEAALICIDIFQRNRRPIGLGFSEQEEATYFSALKIVEIFCCVIAYSRKDTTTDERNEPEEE